MHISGLWHEAEKANIGSEKANIDPQKANIGPGKANIEVESAQVNGRFTSKTAAHVHTLQDVLGSGTIFCRTDVQRILGLKPTRSTELLREMSERGLIEPVSGHGKGKYRFK